MDRRINPARTEARRQQIILLENRLVSAPVGRRFAFADTSAARH